MVVLGCCFSFPVCGFVRTFDSHGLFVRIHTSSMSASEKGAIETHPYTGARTDNTCSHTLISIHRRFICNGDTRTCAQETDPRVALEA